MTTSKSQVEIGAELVAEGTRFTLFSRHALAVDVCLFDTADAAERERLPLADNGDGIWSGIAAGVGAGQLYGFRVHGPFEPRNGHRFNAAKLLTDPRALALTGEPSLNDSFAGSQPGDDLRPDPRDTGICAPKSIVVDRRFDWQNDTSPAVPWEDTILYECHVRGMSIRHPHVPESRRGTYLGLASEPILDHFDRMGVTSVELLPVQQIATEPHLLQRGMSNYFGYSPLGFFAPHAGYASKTLGGQVSEFKQMVRSLHRRGIEVILDLVLNHTAEGNHHGRTLSLRGIDNRTYYRLQADDQGRYQDSTGCGNSLAADNPQVTRLLIDCLRYWVQDMHVDGFRFDLAVTLGRTEKGFSPKSPFFQAIADDPLLSHTKMIAEPWDLGADGYQRGRFPTGWLEWDDQFRDTTRRIWKGDAVECKTLRHTFAGFDPSSAKAEPGIDRDIHFVTCHDGFTLEDLVSYEHKHNWDNHEDNHDGHDHNLSRNWGVEGPTDSDSVRKRRRRAKQNLFATMLLASGVPMISHGDELSRSQAGNNNAYCQDNELTWLDWKLDSSASEMLTFTADLVALRKRMAPLAAGSKEGLRRWIRTDGRSIVPSSHCRPGEALGLLQDGPQGIFLTLINPRDRDHLFRLPRQSQTGHWRRLLSTVRPGARRVTQATYKLCARSISVLEYLLDGN